MKDIEDAALATLACPPDRRGEFDVLFRAYFWGDEELAAAGEPENETAVEGAIGGHPTPPKAARKAPPPSSGGLCMGRRKGQCPHGRAQFLRPLSEQLVDAMRLVRQ